MSVTYYIEFDFIFMLDKVCYVLFEGTLLTTLVV